jgi:hypothetical protein
MLRRLTLCTLALACLAHPVVTPGTAAPAPEQKPSLVLKTGSEKEEKPVFVFDGSFPGPIHRSGPEHFKLTRISDGERIDLVVAYDRATLDEETNSPRERFKEPKKERNRLVYNHLFRSIRFALDSGSFERKDVAVRADRLELYGRAKLEPGTRYRLTWACWPVGAKEAAEVSCEFEMSK